jgi:hypothetical protein
MLAHLTDWKVLLSGKTPLHLLYTLHKPQTMEQDMLAIIGETLLLATGQRVKSSSKDRFHDRLAREVSRRRWFK